MNRYELIAALEAANIDSDRYQIVGIDEFAPIDGGAFLREEEDGSWGIGGYERGIYDLERRFDSEEDACELVYRDLTRVRPVYVLSESEKQRTDKITEEAKQRYRKLIEEHRKSQGDETDC